MVTSCTYFTSTFWVDFRYSEAYEKASANIFADLNLKNPKELLAKITLVQNIYEAVKKCGLKQSYDAEILGLDAIAYATLMNGRFLDIPINKLEAIWLKVK